MRLGRVRNESGYMSIKDFHENEGWSISWMCRQLGINRSSYYKWLHRDIPGQERENMVIAELIKEYDERFGHILGYRRMTIWINRLNRTHYNSKRIHRIMKVLGIHSVIRKKKSKYNNSTSQTVSENILERDFFASAPNEKWVTDVTEFKIPGTNRKLYLSLIMDLYDRFPVSYVMAKRNNNTLVLKTFQKAVEANPGAKPIFHSDRGFQYTSRVFNTKLVNEGMIQSMSRPGHCVDNGPVEGLWGIIKTEMYHLFDIHDEKSLIESIEGYINFYAYERFQERFNSKTPYEVRQEALCSETPLEYPIPVNRRIEKYKSRWTAA